MDFRQKTILRIRQRENGDWFRLEYRLVESIAQTAEECQVALYGLAAALFDPNGAEQTVIHAISPVASRVEALMARLADGFVTPCTLRDVLEDLAAENPDFCEETGGNCRMDLLY